MTPLDESHQTALN